jgi:hypothetical protein
MKNVAVFASLQDNQIDYLRSLIAENNITATLVVGEAEHFAQPQHTEALEERIKFLEGRIYQMRCVLDFQEAEQEETLDHATAMRLGEELLENPEMLQDEEDFDDTDEDDDEEESPLVISMTKVFRISQITGRTPMEILKIFRDYKIRNQEDLLREVQTGRFDQYLPSNYKERVIGLLGENELPETWKAQIEKPGVSEEDKEHLFSFLEDEEDEEELILDFNPVNLLLISQATGYSVDQIKNKLIEETIPSESHLVKALIGGELDKFLTGEVKKKVFQILEGY